MNVLLIGSGGREHALGWAFARSPSIGELHAAPGNPGLATIAHCHPVAGDDGEAVLGLARSVGADLVVVGPEAPLVAGVADVVRRAGIPVFGPSAAAARIEGSKTFAKDVMDAAGIPTARRLDAPSAPCVLKADGLAAGKGVFICETDDEVRAGLLALSSFGGSPVVEELMTGPEVSLFTICDGNDAIPLVVAQDFKRVGDGGRGPNTGGMGSYAPVAGIDRDAVEALVDLAVRPLLAQLRRLGAPFVGTLFTGLMLTADGPRVLEYNCRFGDPETQSIVPLVEGDLLAALSAAAAGDVAGVVLDATLDAAVTVVLAAEGYPATSDRGTPIEGVELAEATGALVFHAGTALRDGSLVTNGGRILGITGCGGDVAAARAVAYRAADLVRWPGVRRREDIALEAASGAVVSGAVG